MRRALRIAVKLQLAITALLVHSVVFTRTASKVMKDCLEKQMAEKFTAKQYAEMYGGHTITEEQTSRFGVYANFR